MNTQTDFQISYGTTPTLEISISGTINNNFGGNTFLFTAKGDLELNTPYSIQKSGIVNTVSGQNSVMFSLSIQDTSIQPGIYYYDFKLINLQGQVIKKQPGTFELVNQVTIP